MLFRVQDRDGIAAAGFWQQPAFGEPLLTRGVRLL